MVITFKRLELAGPIKCPRDQRAKTQLSGKFQPNRSILKIFGFFSLGSQKTVLVSTVAPQEHTVSLNVRLSSGSLP